VALAEKIGALAGQMVDFGISAIDINSSVAVKEELIFVD